MPQASATILVVTDRRGEIPRINALLSEFQLDAKCRACGSLDELRAACHPRAPELIAFRPDGADRTLDGINELRNSLEDPPGLVLISDGVQPDDYLQAGKVQASNLVDLGMPAQFDFVIRRELDNVRLQRRYSEARRKLESEQVTDNAVLERPETLDSLPPIASAIDKALANEELELLFQPILSVGASAHENHEIFLRIRSEEGYLMPADFIPTAERYGLMPAIDRWVVQQAIARFKREQGHRPAGRPPLRFFVNLSLHSLVDPLVINQIIKHISEAELPAGSFVIEVDKDTILTRLKVSKSVNRSVKKMQLQFSMDHYDASDNKLNYLKHIDLDFIKLKQSLVRRIHEKPENFDSVVEIVRVAHGAGMDVVASQVETARELAVLYEAGVDHVQGFVIAEPSGVLQEGIALDEIAEETGSGA